MEYKLILEIEEHYRKNRQRLLKRLSFRAGTIWAAEDIVQEAYARAIKYNKSYSGAGLDPWISTIVNNVLHEYHNAERVYGGYGEDEEEAVDLSEFKGIRRDMFKLILQKSVVQQEVLMYYFKHQYSPTSIAAVTEYSYAQCHQIIQRFRNELKEIYSE